MSTCTSHLRQLIDIISKNVDIIENLSKMDGVDHPSIDDIYTPLYDAESPEEKFTVKHEVFNAAMLATSAASQLIATLRLPGPPLFTRANAFHIPSALRIASEACIVEQLQDAGPQGLHVRELAAKTGTHPALLGRALRLLATHYVFREIRPNVFVNNRISSVFDTGVDTSVLTALARIKSGNKKENPTKQHGISNVQGGKYPSHTTVAGLISTDEVFKSSSFLPEVAFANDTSKTAFQLAHQFDGSIWEFLEMYPRYLQHVQMAMVSWNRLYPQELSSQEFNWSGLPKSSLVVDVGGGNGSHVFEIINKAPHVKFIVQDREKVIRNVSIPTWESDPKKRKMMETGQVKFEVQDFFEAQPSHIGQAAVLHIRWVIHDWTASESVEILGRLHAVASPVTRLIIIDKIVPYACPPPPEHARIEGANLPSPPAPLLANFGEVNSDAYLLDFTMMAVTGGQERTLGEFEEITQGAGWKIEWVFQGSSLSEIVCVKA
ncbi:S-adenosyl-L-methionine-dependent methyltransferase [Infundibulicybe gibba]|nr:S-adenosyl-L-methionine-dependent methyltransferase [Infundibulicybe gibba]